SAAAESREAYRPVAPAQEQEPQPPPQPANATPNGCDCGRNSGSAVSSRHTSLVTRHGTYTHRSSSTTAPGTPSAGTSIAENGTYCRGKYCRQTRQAPLKSARFVWNCCARTRLDSEVPALRQMR